MKIVLFAALCLIPLSFAHANGESVPAVKPAEKTPVDTVEVAPSAAQGLFERVRDAHTRALQKGAVAPAASAT